MQDCVFVKLPSEVLLLIFIHVDSRTIIDELSEVCSRFQHILSNREFWNNKIRSLLPEITATEINFHSSMDLLEVCAKVE